MLVDPPDFIAGWIDMKLLRVGAESSCHVTLALSIFIIMGITLERYQVVLTNPSIRQSAAEKSTGVLILKFLTPALVSAVLFNLPRILSKNESLQSNTEFLRFQIIFQLFHPIGTTGLLPLILLGILTFKMFTRIPLNSSVQGQPREFPVQMQVQTSVDSGNQEIQTTTVLQNRPIRKRARDFKLAQLVIVLALVFLTLNFPRLAIGIYEVLQLQKILNCQQGGEFYFPPTLQWKMDIFAQLGAVLKASLNLLILLILDDSFRKTIGRVCRFKVNPSNKRTDTRRSVASGEENETRL
ncbi:uncharacterized protein LOC111703328 [Eurytemora carolleeae]|uniref:uncharacterized protein LOC111703328 n=1 Tax=Eurytemora carolleeae TaxID=1294199 RepID=UPI000C77327C|nr:uncharacterized protein LOC111703328 [Eurytemora carolleeae]|eukprot:XP_023331002.1 uncharacterized protein LOC111703328 [Eurytemora affinis]